MGKLSKEQVDEFFGEHLPYRNGILRAHLKLCEPGPYRGNQHVLRACFEASLVTGRMYLNVLGITTQRGKDELKEKKFAPDGDDVSAADLGGKLLVLDDLSATDKELFLGFLIMANKGAAHLTLPRRHQWERTHDAIRRIEHFVKANLYDATNRKM